MVEQSTNNILENVYKFNAKELDPQTGYYYDGARYYDPGASIFLSVDPLAEQFPAWNPYHYVHNNPINLVDPTGMSAEGGGRNYLGSSNARTIGFSLRHPIAAVSIGTFSKGSTNISTNAVRFSTRIGLNENSRREGSQVNAFRHTLWQAKIASKFGRDIATEVGNAHETNPNAVVGSQFMTSFSSLSEADQTIDLLNNAIGREIGVSNPNANMQELASKTLDYYKDNGLWSAEEIFDSNGNSSGWNVRQQKLNDEQYQSAKSIIDGLNSNGFNSQEQKVRDVQAEKNAKSYDNAVKL